MFFNGDGGVVHHPSVLSGDSHSDLARNDNDFCGAGSHRGDSHNGWYHARMSGGVHGNRVCGYIPGFHNTHRNHYLV